MTTPRYLSSCAFCAAVRGDAPSFKLDETERSYAFVPLPPLVEGHALVIPKAHAAKLHELPDEYLIDTIMLVKKVVVGQGLTDYNILQNDGRVAYQSVDHVHFHIIPKPDANTGLNIEWPHKKEDEDALRREVFQKLGVTGKIQYQPQLMNTVLKEVFGS